MRTKAFKAAFPHTLPVMAGYIFLGIGFGILLASKGYAFWWATVMSIFVYAGSMQYAAIELFSAGVGYAYTAIMTVIIQIRHLFYGLSLLGKYKNVGKVRPLLIHELTDETYSLVCSCEPPEGVDAGLFYLFISMLDHIYWIIGCTVGALLGSLVSFNTEGIDFVMTALFIVIFVNQWIEVSEGKRAKPGAKGKSSHSMAAEIGIHLPAIIGVGSSVICLIIFGPDNFIIPAMIAIAALLTAFRGKLEESGADPVNTAAKDIAGPGHDERGRN